MEAPTSISECIEVARKCAIPVDTIARAYSIEAPRHEVDSLMAEAMARTKTGEELFSLVGIMPSWAVTDNGANRLLKELTKQFGPNPEEKPLFRGCRALIQIRQMLAGDFFPEEWTPPSELEEVRTIVRSR